MAWQLCTFSADSKHDGRQAAAVVTHASLLLCDQGMTVEHMQALASAACLEREAAGAADEAEALAQQLR